jgi:hypothetical protein
MRPGALPFDRRISAGPKKTTKNPAEAGFFVFSGTVRNMKLVPEEDEDQRIK